MIRAKHIEKVFKLYNSPADRLKEILLRRKLHRSFHALRDVSFEVQEGETLGIVGQNGAGKSTLLKILTGVSLPDSGTVEVDGKITGLLELGTGFNMEFTGLQNIYLNGTLLGMSKQEVAERLDSIMAFSELGDFIREPIKTYSSGMVMRLAFSIAIHADPRAFVVDEALSVGDAYFQQKCMRKIRNFKAQGGAIVFVSHDLGAIKLLCDSALFLERGSVVDEGNPSKVINTYNFFLSKKNKGEEIQIIQDGEKPSCYGNLKVEVTGVRMLNGQGIPSEAFVAGETCTIGVDLQSNEKVDQVTVGILIRDRFGQDIFGTNSYHLNFPLALEKGERRRVNFDIQELNLGRGKYSLSIALHREDTHVVECYQWFDFFLSFEVLASSDYFFLGFSKLKPKLSVERI